MYMLRFFLVSALFSLPFFALAQTMPSYQEAMDKLAEEQRQFFLQKSTTQKSVVGNYLDVVISPPTPEPGAPVRIAIESYLVDLYKASISWSINGDVIERGTGKNIFTFKNGPSGKLTTISVHINTNTGEIVDRTFYFTPIGITTMWEADAYTPPFYKGKAMMVPQASVRIVATPNTVNTPDSISTARLVYTWKKDGNVDASASGYGKNYYSFVGPKPLTNTKISLGVSSLDDSMGSEVQVYLPQVRPFVLFYEKDPLLGVLYNKPLSSDFTLDKKEFSVSAEPYFFSNERGEAQSLKYIWSVNGSTVQNYGRNITLRNDTGAKGSSVVSLSMRGITKTFQSANKDFKVNFLESSSSARPIF
ncbi:MAG: hypothetical protein UW27_C0007G0017 [Parcubacteria group bacterium GW2011_GWA1_44_13]|uniref:Uncharacterized protein n=1 Tax=Candidatus Nomurabacteria bacterium GW2011_GWB1_44_12 TaxID=1618748 RepID=A0A837I820_9BACT|nr:MAG: hypothetical protein UW17_C0034G0006 [Candidatus Nomurabacteria bacterium GW2011_GWD1_44_10]KKT36938.1 MAG: hypothetical protein UW25_C0004G0266 [Candidatus Nomurabacteria bacterium GW2011_GWB1_44_12]KKT37962.1 MAG: hypothetical protein UW27_C0007G0017 [Parcubacteria group bacterium GW2011_GWA1_44_13]KKT60826.1 MAG: hypothetical protein UW54_C0003G0004 [Parcubacteria group bacterium GW2011_GWC1_44_26]HBB44114.1 hypothetical protein [Candidatus Yonathbacteria bacterium]